MDQAYVLTAHHVVEKAATVRVTMFSETSYPRPDRLGAEGIVVAGDAVLDLALLSVSGGKPPVNRLPVCRLGEDQDTEGFGGFAVGCDAGGAGWHVSASPAPRAGAAANGRRAGDRVGSRPSDGRGTLGRSPGRFAWQAAGRGQRNQWWSRLLRRS